MTPRRRALWRKTFVTFLKSVTLRRSKQRRGGPLPRLVLKSPPHTARVSALQELFPGAKFIHIVRNPAEVFSSTVRLWTALFDVQGCQTPRPEALVNGSPDIENYVLASFDSLYRNFAQARAGIAAGQFCETRYEDLVANPLAELERIYAQLGLDGFEAARTQFSAYLATVSE